MNNSKYHILLVNDDGINSPGLWAAAETLSDLAYVTVAAPRIQWSGAGRSHPTSSDGVIKTQTLNVHDKEWTVYAVGGSPAQTVIHAIAEICPQRPDLVVSGINYGENAGIGVTASGTVGAALEAASMGIPALAVSLEVVSSLQLTYSREIDFTGAKYFTALFAQKMLDKQMPPDVDILKLEIPDDASETTPWKITRLDRQPYYRLSIKPRLDKEKPVRIDYEVDRDISRLSPDSDNHALLVDRVVAVTPLSIDFTSRVNFEELEKSLKN
jgi:5'-nucleotidase